MPRTKSRLTFYSGCFDNLSPYSYQEGPLALCSYSYEYASSEFPTLIKSLLKLAWEWTLPPSIDCHLVNLPCKQCTATSYGQISISLKLPFTDFSKLMVPFTDLAFLEFRPRFKCLAINMFPHLPTIKCLAIKTMVSGTFYRIWGMVPLNGTIYSPNSKVVNGNFSEIGQWPIRWPWRNKPIPAVTVLSGDHLIRSNCLRKLDCDWLIDCSRMNISWERWY